MAVTILMHMKEEKDFPAAHLYNTINYVLDVKNDGKKTDYGKWVGGNAGCEAADVFHNFMNTKKFWDKEHGRQGYHFVISLEKGEGDAQKCYDIAKEFCEKYLGDDYEYVFAVHNDKEHLHAHIVFNSVSRTTGLKYHYKKGDWKKDIQPVTDMFCKKYGLKELTFKEKTTGKPYGRWSQEQTGDLDWGHIMRADLDWAVEHSTIMEEFYETMGKLSYSLTVGLSEDHGRFFHIRYTDENGAVHKRRSYNSVLGKEYSPDRILERIKNREPPQRFYEEVSEKLTGRMNARMESVSEIRNRKIYGRMYQAVSYYKLPNPFAVPIHQVRRDMVRLGRLMEECSYLNENPKSTYAQLCERKNVVDGKLHELYIERKYLKEMEEAFRLAVPNESIKRLRQLKKKIQEAGEWTEDLEQAQDELEELEEMLPSSLLESEERLLKCEGAIEVLKNEKRILDRIIKSEEDMELNKEPDKKAEMKTVEKKL